MIDYKLRLYYIIGLYNISKEINMKPLKVALIDLSGTLHVEDCAISGAVDALKRLQQTRLKVKFVTNTTKDSRDTLYKRLCDVGFKLEPKEIFSSLAAARTLIDKRNLHPYFMLSDDAMKDFKDINLQKHDSVLVGLAPRSFNYENMTIAMRLLLDGCPLIAIHKARYFKRNDGLSIGPGAFVAGLEYSSGVTAEVVGKPEKSFFYSAIEEFCCTPQEAIMIGDDVRDDVEGAMRAGLLGALVKTGKYLPGDELKIDPPPTLVGENFAEVVDQILTKWKLD